MTRLVLALTGALMIAGAVCGAGGPRAGVWKRMDEIRPPAELVKWQGIPWLTDLNEGLRAARAEKRPLLIWASGDDPLERC
jgi:hypothetical protein